jgi:invasion protein IalB
MDFQTSNRAAEDGSAAGIDMMTRLGSFVLALALACSAGAAGAASEKPKSEAAAPKKAGDAISSDPQMTTATYGDWVERCQRLDASGEQRRICEVAQTVAAAGQSGPLAEIAIGRPNKGAPLRLTLVLPLNVGFPSAPKITAEGGDPLELSWRRCVPAGCFADSVFDAGALRVFRDAKTATVESRAAGGGYFHFAISLRGLPQALDALIREP